MTDNNEDLKAAELQAIKDKADLLGITYSPNIGAKALQERIGAHLAAEGNTPSDDGIPEAEETVVVKETAIQQARRLRAEALKLVRVKLTCMNPNKKEWTSEIFSVGNGVLGTVKRTVPFNVEWHVEQILLDMIRERKFQMFYTVKTKNGVAVRKGKLLNEFGIEFLPDLTEAQLKKLAQRQAMAAGTSEDEEEAA